jgi:hypothetical protein
MGLDAGSVTGGPRLLLRLEGVAVLALATVVYARGDQSWWLYLALILAPDISLAGYVVGSRVGAIAYNSLHTYLGPALVAAGFGSSGLGTAIALVWAAHIGMDRSLGLGLKYGVGFRSTHLGSVGASHRSPSTG